MALRYCFRSTDFRRGSEQGLEDRIGCPRLCQLLHPVPHPGKALRLPQQQVDLVRKRDDIRRAHGDSLLEKTGGIDLFLSAVGIYPMAPNTDHV